jgi:LmbE family N-acetylglucosaminyl deacetylase
MNILVIAAHPDDEVLGCGATMARLASEGAAVSILILATGLTSRLDFDQGQKEVLLRTHHDRAVRAGHLIGAREVNLAGYPDQLMDTVPLLDITQAIEREIERVRPDTIFTHHGGDLNMDHVIAYRATLTATRPVPGCTVREVYAYEIPSSTEWSFQRFEPKFQPNVFVDIAGSIEKKIEAMQVYESETRPFPHPRSPKALRSLAARWGSVAGLEAAEAFELVRKIKGPSSTPN